MISFVFPSFHGSARFSCDMKHAENFDDVEWIWRLGISRGNTNMAAVFGDEPCSIFYGWFHGYVGHNSIGVIGV